MRDENIYKGETEKRTEGDLETHIFIALHTHGQAEYNLKLSIKATDFVKFKHIFLIIPADRIL